MHPRDEPSGSGAGGSYSSPNPIKSETQSQLDSFLIYFGESAGTRGNERGEGDKSRPCDEESELSDGAVTRTSQVNQKNQAEQLKKILLSFNAPEDASKCVKVESLQSYIKNEAKMIKNPRRSYFELSRRYYKAKYPDGDNKRVIEVESFLHTKDNKNYLRNLSLDIIQT